MLDQARIKEVMIPAVLQGGQILRDNLDQIKTITQKSNRRDIVTNIDLEVEKVLIDAIKNNFPDHAILSEEAGAIVGQSEYRWLIDPIDGTVNYSHGHPPFRIAVCLLATDVPILTILYGPTRDQLFVAEKGKGAWLNNQPIQVSANTELANSIFMIHLSSQEIPRLRTINSLERVFEHTAHVRMFGSGSAAMSYIAEGRYDVFYNLATNPWDIIPGALLIEEAGGKVTDIMGEKISLDSTSVLATNGHVHAEMIELLKGI